MALSAFHGALDRLAVLAEDLRRRAPEPARLASAAPLEAFGPLPPLPAEGPPREGAWSAPSPRPLWPGEPVSLVVTPAQGPRRGTAVLVPPWKIASPGLVSGFTALLAARGHDVWMLCPPCHMGRTVPGLRSGEGFVSLDLFRLRAVFEQLVVEIRWCLALAASRGPAGVVGLSLGALAAAFAATAPERADFAALVAPPRLDLVLAETGIGRRYLALAARSGAPVPDRAELAAALAPFDPAARAPGAGRLFVAAGAHDRIAPPAGPLGLARAWGVAPRVYPRGHLSLLFLCRALRRELGEFV